MFSLLVYKKYYIVYLHGQKGFQEQRAREIAIPSH